MLEGEEVGRERTEAGEPNCSMKEGTVSLRSREKLVDMKRLRTGNYQTPRADITTSQEARDWSS
jgi:hypothetical protein